MNSIPLSLYIHFPWCVQKCPYCDFNSHQLKAELPEQKYIEALKADLEQQLNWVDERKLTSIFMGGGTPSLFQPEHLRELLSYIEAKIEFSDSIEITLEANPGTTDAALFQGYFDIGINRLSIGVQSFNDCHLKALGRIHDREQALEAIEAVKAAGFYNFNIDLMHTLPEQTFEQAMQDIDLALASEALHISWYQLTLESNTLFHRFPPKLPSDSIAESIFFAGQERLLAADYKNYEVSAFGKNQCQHNMNYWQFGDYLGIGAGAHGKITKYKDDKSIQVFRTQNFKHPRTYLEHANSPKSSPVETVTNVSTENLSFEFMMNVLRLNQAIPESLLVERTGLSFTQIDELLTQAAQKGLIDYAKQEISKTDLGKSFLNDLLAIFLPQS